MRLADFIEINADLIADGAEAFAATQAPAGVHLDAAAMRDDIPEILSAVVRDMRTAQDSDEQRTKSEGRAPVPGGPKSAARNHGRLRAKSGFNVDQMVAEYRALRAAVLRLWIADRALDQDALEDLIRFNEAVDQAVAESVADFSQEAESWRHVFLGVLGHDLRGPLGVIVTTSELLLRMTQDTPYSAQTERIIRSGRRMSRLVDDLLDYSRTALGMGIRIVRAESDLHEALEEEIDLLRATFPGVTIRFNSTGPVRGYFDASRVREALSNLVANATRYGDAGGEIVVRLSGDGDEIELVVSNRGAALSSMSLAAMFEPLQRGPDIEGNGRQDGLGLGLFIVREIVRAHGGEVIASASGDETAFIMRLPANPVIVPAAQAS